MCFSACKKENISELSSSEIDVYPIPTLNILYDEDIPIDNKIEMSMEIMGTDNDTIYFGSIERRGGFSIGFEKHSYEIDLETDVPLTNLPEDDDWILNANYIDKTFLRHVVSYDLFRSMNPTNEASHTTYVNVELNNEYNGLYVLMEKLDKSSLEIDDDDPEAFIFKEPHIFKQDYATSIAQDQDNFNQQIFPKITVSDKNDLIAELNNYIATSEDIDFSNNIGSIFDIDNIIDWHLLLLISNNNDGIVKNFYLYKKDASTPMRVSPWDYDHSFGRDGDNELNLDTRPLDINKSILFKRLLNLPWYKTILKDRWLFLNQTQLLSVDALKNRCLNLSTAIANHANRNFENWSLDSEWYYDDNNFLEEVDVVLEFIEIRHARLASYFEDL